MSHLTVRSDRKTSTLRLETQEPGSIEEMAYNHGFHTMPAILNGDECVKLLRNGD